MKMWVIVVFLIIALAIMIWEFIVSVVKTLFAIFLVLLPIYIIYEIFKYSEW